MPISLPNKTLLFATSILLASNVPAMALDMTEIGQIKIGDGEGYAEMIR